MSDAWSRLAEILAPGWVGSVIGILGIAAAGITYVLSRQRSILAFRTRGIRLLGHDDAKLPPAVTVQHEGRNIPRLTRSLVVLWNAGERTLMGRDIVESDPLRIEFDSEAAILSVALARCSREVINASAIVATDRAGCVYVGFEFLDTNDGLVLEVLHSGQRRHPMVKGTIRGMPAGPKSLGRLLSRRPPPLPFPFPGSRRVFAALVVIVGLAFAAYGIWYPVADVASMPTKPTAFRFGIATAGVLYAGLGCLLFWFFRRRYPRSLHSEELE